MASAGKMQPPYYTDPFFKDYWGFNQMLPRTQNRIVSSCLGSLTRGNRVRVSGLESQILTTLFVLLYCRTIKEYEQALMNISVLNPEEDKIHNMKRRKFTSEKYQSFQARLDEVIDEVIDAAKNPRDVKCCKLVVQLADEFLNRDDITISPPETQRPDPLVQTLCNKKLTVIPQVTLNAVIPKSSSPERVEQFLKLLPQPSANHNCLSYDRLQLLELWNSLSTR